MACYYYYSESYVVVELGVGGIYFRSYFCIYIYIYIYIYNTNLNNSLQQHNNSGTLTTVSLVDCFCLSTLAPTSLLIAGVAIRYSKYKSLPLVCLF